MPFPIDPNAPRVHPSQVARNLAGGAIADAIRDSIAADVDRFAADWLAMEDYCAAELRAWLED